jgi:hypothetical protein
MDFFNNFNKGDVIKSINSIVEFAEDNSIPLLSVMNHHQLLKDVNRKMNDIDGYKCLLNLDAHSDIAASDIDELNCGTWVSYVKWRGAGEYIWIRSDYDEFVGACNGGDLWYYGSDWYKLSSTWGANINIVNSVLTKNVVAIGLCMSPGYSTYENISIFKDVVKKYKIPYKKGRRIEHGFGTKAKPPKIIKI